MSDANLPALSLSHPPATLEGPLVRFNELRLRVLAEVVSRTTREFAYFHRNTGGAEKAVKSRSTGVKFCKSLALVVYRNPILFAKNAKRMGQPREFYGLTILYYGGLSR